MRARSPRASIDARSLGPPATCSIGADMRGDHPQSIAKHPKYVLFGHFGAGNWGNECTLHAALQWFRRRRPDAQLTATSTTPADTTQRHGVQCFGLCDAQRDGRAVRRKDKPAWRRLLQLMAAQPRQLLVMVRALRSADALVMTGTGMITDWGEGPLGLPFSMWQWALVARALRCRVIFMSVGVEEIESRVARFWLRRALALATYRSFRDAHSRARLTRLGMHYEADPLFPDLAFTLPAPSVPASQRVVGLGVFSYRSRGEGGDEARAAYRAYIDKLGQFISFLYERGHGVRLLIGDVSDIPVAEEVLAWLRERALPAPLFEEATTVEQLLQQIAQTDLVVGTRFHTILLGLRLGRPAVSVSYERKNDVLMESMGLAEYCQSLDEFDLERLIAQFSQLEARAGELGPRIAEHAAGLAEQLETQYRTLFGA
jgi:polysaccharide pyruvyl transferase WcaK-like protein